MMAVSVRIQGAFAALALASIAACGGGSRAGGGGGLGGATGAGPGTGGQGGSIAPTGTGGDVGAGGAVAGSIGAAGSAASGGGGGATGGGVSGAAGASDAGGAGASGGGAGSIGGASGTTGTGGAASASGQGGSSVTGAAGAGGGGRGGAPSGGRGGTGGTGGGAGTGGTSGVSGLPARATVIDLLRRANTYFVNKWPDPGTRIDSSHDSHIWTRAVYYEGLMALNAADPQASYVDYAVRWGTSHSWGLVGGTTTRSADDQCAGQTYIDLYNMDAQAMRTRDIKADIDMVVSGTAVNDWTWVDAIQMAMPVYAKLGKLGTSTGYTDKAYAMYRNTKNVQGGNGLYSKTDHLWWRDQDFDPPYTEPNGKSCYWSRGNGWVFAALTRVLDIIPANEAHRAEYLADFQAMAEALRAVQRSDGFWNVSLFDPTHLGGPELTGTSLFIYGMAWGVRTGVLSSTTYGPVIARGWTAMASTVHTNGFLGYVQGTGKQPSDGQPVTFDSVPNFEDFGLGCFLLGGSEIARLAAP
jgi:unsaturated rhamnogalacturonyl hydrolase